MLKRFPIITLQIPCEIVYQDGQRVVAVIPSRADAEYVCRWCFGRPMPGFDVCSRVQCISAVQAVDSLNTISWRGEDR
jgi:hypothetical protein